MARPNTATTLQHTIARMMPPQVLLDVCIRVINFDQVTGLRKEENVFANKFLVSFYSSYLRDLIACHTSTGTNQMICIDLHLGTIANAAQAFRTIVQFLYTGVLVLHAVQPDQILQVLRVCRMPGVELQLTELLMHEYDMQMSQSRMHLLQQILGQQLQSITSTVVQPSTGDHAAPVGALPSTKNAVLQARKMMCRELELSEQKQIAEVTKVKRSSKELKAPPACTSSPTSVCKPKDNHHEVILPSNDKEGWCRNKKYIEQVPNGYMCMVCRKVYGRYNSVSYHVTIYHRNPPIKCDEEGCPFRTREARYIHFHKYYRHRIPLPDNIDLGSRKCPFCRHVSKSPAMLDKHINRHFAEGDPVQRSVQQCQQRSRNVIECNHRSTGNRTAQQLEHSHLVVQSTQMFKHSRPDASQDCTKFNSHTAIGVICAKKDGDSSNSSSTRSGSSSLASPISDIEVVSIVD